MENFTYSNLTSTPPWLLKINSFKEWNPRSLIPTRINRFVALLLSNNTYNLSFNSIPPKDLRLQFQRR